MNLSLIYFSLSLSLYNTFSIFSPLKRVVVGALGLGPRLGKPSQFFPKGQLCGTSSELLLRYEMAEMTFCWSHFPPFLGGIIGICLAVAQSWP